MDKRVCVGVVVGAQGVRGAVRIKAFTAEPRAIGEYGPVEDEAARRRFRVSVTGQAKGLVTANLEGVAGRDAAEALKGTRLYVDRASLPTPQEDEFYHADLIGLRAERADGSLLGHVRRVDDFGAGDVVEIAAAEGGELLLPFTKAVVPVVDLEGGRLVVDPPIEVEARPEDGGEDG